MSSLHPNQITLPTFNKTLSRYASTAPSALADLDTFRYTTAPSSLAALKGAKYLSKPEVEKLVEWKLKHGTFRPSLMKLVRDNPTQNVEAITASAFKDYASKKDALKSLKTLTQLRGIGPATASLLLSVLDPDEVPFFSDEVFRWTHWGEPGSAKGDGWDRVIKYTVKEYREVVDRVGGVRERLGVKAVDLEKVAYVLGMEGADVGGEVAEESEEEEEEGEGKEKRSGGGITDEAYAEIMEAVNSGHAVFIANGKLDGKALVPTEEEERQGQAKKGRKRKVVVVKDVAEGTRRSTRRKT